MDATYDPWSTHLPALAAAVSKYGKRVLEIGAGWYSTPLLYAMSNHVLTLESDGLWASKFSGISNGHMVIVPNLVAAAKELTGGCWDVVFIDCEGNQYRRQCAELFINERCCIVAHDTQEAHWQEFLKKVKYLRHYDFMMPRTSHMSNVLDVTQ